ncbi:SDR family oxidoreductase [Phenylobacterium sp.]|jgi:NAD(P)-dependent dehydrogenase (short-subunit alcohol dehydrogenase family)|uniref:SDR family oxidoreductase n=1 Tax=Phenylobacterium sp. TaxID=1871053 RepID=UPI002F3F4251
MSGVCDGRVVIVTGAGAGLGRAYALGLAAEGAKVVVNDLGVGLHGESGEAMGAAEQVVAEIKALGGEAMANTGDVADFDAMHGLIQQVLEKYGDLHAVVNNAGFVRDRMFVSCTPEEWDAVIRVHLRGHFCAAHWAAKYWRDQQKQGKPVDARIVNTSSGAGLQGSVGQSAYSAAKGGIASLTLVQAAELGRYGVTANALAPNARTRMTQDAFGERMNVAADAFDAFDPANTAPLVAWLCSEESRDVTGQVFELLGGDLSVSQGWTDSPHEDRGGRWPTTEIGAAVRRILAKREPAKPVYGAG